LSRSLAGGERKVLHVNTRSLVEALTYAIVLPLGLAWSGHSFAQSSSSQTDTELSKESLNPVSRQITLPLRYEAELENGVDDQAKQTIEIDNAIVPFQLNDDWALITRTKLPLIVQPPKKKGEEWTTGLGNGYTTFFFSPTRGNGFYWGAGPLLYFPTATNSALGVNRWGSGVSAAFIKKDQSPWVIGAVVNNIWSFGGEGGDRTNQFLLNPFVSYHFGSGWAVGSSLNITANWIASGEKWTVPLGGGFSKTLHAGKQAIKFSFDAYYNAVRPKSDKDTVVLQSTLTFLFPR